MPTHVALLRGFNVRGNNKIAMADLREVVTSLGHTDVATYIQSGNIVFSAPGADAAALASGLEQAIAAAFAARPGLLPGTPGAGARAFPRGRGDRKSVD